MGNKDTNVTCKQQGQLDTIYLNNNISCSYCNDTGFYIHGDDDYCLQGTCANFFHDGNKNKCIKECNDSYFKFFNNTEKYCYENCPSENPYYLDNNKICLDQCPYNALYYYNDTKSCLNKCKDNHFKLNNTNLFI